MVEHLDAEVLCQWGDQTIVDLKLNPADPLLPVGSRFERQQDETATRELGQMEPGRAARGPQAAEEGSRPRKRCRRVARCRTVRKSLVERVHPLL